MLRLLADENFNGRILRGLLRRLPALDIVRAQDIDDLYGADDRAVLEWAAVQGRLVLTHDLATMAGYAYQRVMAGKAMRFGVAPAHPLAVAVGTGGGFTKSGGSIHGVLLSRRSLSDQRGLAKTG